MFFAGLAGLFEAMGSAIVFLLWVCAFMVPLGLWKLVEILIWVFHHLQWVA
jgi:hypothetical protein